MKTKTKADDDSQVVKYNNRIKELKGEEIEVLAKKHAEMELDFEYVKELNNAMSMRYNEVMDCLPTSREIDVLINLIEKEMETKSLIDKRKGKLLKLKSAVVTLEHSDPSAKPYKYNEVVGDGETLVQE